MSEPYIPECKHLAPKTMGICPHAGNPQCLCCQACRSGCYEHRLFIQLGACHIDILELEAYRERRERAIGQGEVQVAPLVRNKGGNIAIQYETRHD